MAIELSIDGGDRQRPAGSEEVTRGAAAVRVLARFAAMAKVLGRAARSSFERMVSAQGRGGKRKQMKLVESLALGNRRQLLLVVCDSQRYLVGAGADSVGSILAIDAVPVSRDGFSRDGVSRDRTARDRVLRNGAARGPELVRRRGREAGMDARSRPMAEAELSRWH